MQENHLKLHQQNYPESHFSMWWREFSVWKKKVSRLRWPLVWHFVGLVHYGSENIFWKKQLGLLSRSVLTTVFKTVHKSLIAFEKKILQVFQKRILEFESFFFRKPKMRHFWVYFAHFESWWEQNGSDTFLRETSFEVRYAFASRAQSTIEFATLNYEDEVRVLTWKLPLKRAAHISQQWCDINRFS